MYMNKWGIFMYIHVRIQGMSMYVIRTDRGDLCICRQESSIYIHVYIYIPSYV